MLLASQGRETPSGVSHPLFTGVTCCLWALGTWLVWSWEPAGEASGPDPLGQAAAVQPQWLGPGWAAAHTAGDAVRLADLLCRSAHVSCWQLISLEQLAGTEAVSVTGEHRILQTRPSAPPARRVAGCGHIGRLLSLEPKESPVHRPPGPALLHRAALCWHLDTACV